MALVTKRQCDVFGTTKDVKCYCVKVYEKNDDASKSAAEVFTDAAEWAPRGVARPKK